MPCSIVRRAGILPGLTALALLLPSVPPRAEARTVHARATRAASVATRQSRTDAIAPPEAAAGGVAPVAANDPDAAGRYFAVDVLLPFLWNSDPEQAAHGVPSLETTPEGRLTWSRRFEAVPVRLSALVDVSSDHFNRAHDANADLVYGRLRAQVQTGRDDQEWQPFVSYTPTYTFTPSFARRVDAWHDVALGGSKAWNWDGDLRRVAVARHTDADTVWSVAINGALQRRERDGGPPSFAALVNPSLGWTWSARWNASVEVDITRRWFDRFDDRKRRDWLVTPIVTVEFTPPEGWLPNPGSGAGRALGQPVVDLQVFLSRQASSAEEGRFHQWGAGPVLRTGWRF
jgi:hypothetical protein